MPLEETSSNNGAIHCRRTLREIFTYSLAVRKGKKTDRRAAALERRDRICRGLRRAE